MGSPRRDGRRGESDRDHRKERRRRRRRKRRRERSEENENEEGRKEGVSGKSVVESAAGRRESHPLPAPQPNPHSLRKYLGRSVGRSGNRRRPTIFCIWLAAAAAMATVCLRSYRASLPMKDSPCDWLAVAASIHRPPLPLLQGWSVGQ